MVITALVVGGSSGMGKATARKLLERGIGVILLGRSLVKLEATNRLTSMMALGPARLIWSISFWTVLSSSPGAAVICASP